MPSYHVEMTFDFVTDQDGAVEDAARAAYQDTRDLTQRLGGAAGGPDPNAIELGLDYLLAQALLDGVRRTLPDVSQVKGLSISTQDSADPGWQS